MWAASSSPWSVPSTLFTFTPPQRHLYLAVSVHSRQRSGTENNDDDGKEFTQVTGIMGRVLLSASGAKPKKQQSRRQQQQQQELSQAVERPPLPPSGSDVLLALRRANAEKANKKKKDLSRGGKGVQGNREESSGSATDYKSVEPLVIKSEWSVRLQELEQRLREVMDEAA